MISPSISISIANVSACHLFSCSYIFKAHWGVFLWTYLNRMHVPQSFVDKECDMNLSNVCVNNQHENVIVLIDFYSQHVVGNFWQN